MNPKKILVVDDEPSVAETLVDALQIYYPDAAVVTARSGNEAIGLLRQDFDLVLTDYAMINGSGLDLVKHMRANGHINTPVFMLSAHQEADIVTAAGGKEQLDALNIKTITKPINIQVLKFMIDREMNNVVAHAPFGGRTIGG